MINHPLTILRRTPVFAKPGLTLRKPPVQVGEGTCQVQRRQPVLIRYQIREVSGSRRTGATLLFLVDPKPQTPLPPFRSLLLTNRSTSAATHSKTVGSVNSSWLIRRPLCSGSSPCWRSSASCERGGSDRGLPTSKSALQQSQPRRLNPSQSPWTRNQHLTRC